MQMRLLREANEVGEEDLGQFHKKIYGCGPLQGPLGAGPVRLGTSAPLPELEANQLDLVWDGRGRLPLGDFSPAALRWEYQDVAYSTRATFCPHLHFFRGSPPPPP